MERLNNLFLILLLIFDNVLQLEPHLKQLPRSPLLFKCVLKELAIALAGLIRAPACVCPLIYCSIYVVASLLCIHCNINEVTERYTVGCSKQYQCRMLQNVNSSCQFYLFILYLTSPH